jgi:hypothetical protein
MIFAYKKWVDKYFSNIKGTDIEQSVDGKLDVEGMEL